jgi:hypothetical protein
MEYDHTMDAVTGAYSDAGRPDVDVGTLRGITLGLMGALVDEFGDNDPLVRGLAEIKFPDPRRRAISPEGFRVQMQAAVSTVREVALVAAKRIDARRSAGASPSPGLDVGPATVDPDLWAYIGRVVGIGDWAHAASGACVFLEEQLRSRAPRPHLEAPPLVADLFRAGGPLELGDNPGQRDGWASLVRGLLMGPRNRVQHRIDPRAPDELRRYAAGIIGTVSLILTELRSRHHLTFAQPAIAAADAPLGDGDAER